MDFGVFLPVGNNGWIASTTSPQYMPTFQLNRDVCRLAEQAGFDFALSMVKFRGFGGPTEYWDHTADSLTMLAGLAAATESIKLYASVASPTLHPAMVARMVSTIDDISRGRFGLNVVSGWYKKEFTQMGLWPGDDFYDHRYEYSTEYVRIMQQLWEHGRLTHHGTYFDLDDCMVQPRPQHRIPIVCAGQSEAGMKFAAEVGDYDFLLGPLTVLKAGRERLDAATALTGRSVGAYALVGIIAAPTDEEAAARANHFVDGTDWEAVTAMHAGQSGDASGAVMAQMREYTLNRPTIEFPDDGSAPSVQGSCFHVPHLVGSYERIAHHLSLMQSYAGMSGAILTFPDYIEGVAEFGREIAPRVEAALAFSA